MLGLVGTLLCMAVWMLLSEKYVADRYRADSSAGPPTVVSHLETQNFPFKATVAAEIDAAAVNILTEIDAIDAEVFGKTQAVRDDMSTWGAMSEEQLLSALEQAAAACSIAAAAYGDLADDMPRMHNRRARDLLRSASRKLQQACSYEEDAYRRIGRIIRENQDLVELQSVDETLRDAEACKNEARQELAYAMNIL